MTGTFTEAPWGGQSDKVYAMSRGYRELFKHPYTEIKPPYKSYAFSNPTIRIVDISGEE